MQCTSLTGKIIEAAISVHRELGPGLLESVYQSCLARELQLKGIQHQAEVPIPIWYRGEKITGDGFRLDLLVDNHIVVELKATEKVLPVHFKQLLTYLKLANKPLGLLINFNEVLLKNGITRVANTVNTQKISQ